MLLKLGLPADSYPNRYIVTWITTLPDSCNVSENNRRPMLRFHEFETKSSNSRSNPKAIISLFNWLILRNIFSAVSRILNL